MFELCLLEGTLAVGCLCNRVLLLTGAVVSTSLYLGVSLLWKTEYLDCCTTTMRVCCKKDGHCRRQACSLDIDKAVLLQ